MNSDAVRTRPQVGDLLWIDLPDARERIRHDLPEWLKTCALEMIDQGYTIIRNAVSSDACDAAISGFHAWIGAHEDEAAERRDNHGHYPRIINLHLVVPELSRLFSTNQRALALQDLLFGYRTSLYTSLFYERGSAQPIHRDIPYFCTHPANFYFGLWIALEDVDLDNGPLQVIPGGHRIPWIDPEKIREKVLGPTTQPPPISNVLWDAYQQAVKEACDANGLHVIDVPIQRGDAILWHPLAPHGGAPIRDLSRTRMSLVMHTTPEHVPVYQGDAFFAPSNPLSSEPSWDYRAESGRLLADVASTASFG